MKTFHPVHVLALAAALSLQLPVHAVINGTVPSMAAGAPPIVNPFTTQVTETWKLVGSLGCSAFQISREWVVQAGHCGLGAAGTSSFRGHLGSSTVLGTDCYRQGADDFQLCRLKNPENLTALSSYPALVALPATWRQDTLNAIKYGSVMGYGHAAAGDGLAFVSLDNYPFNFDPAAPSLTPYPFTSDGDSGGAAYWFPPASATGYMVGVLVSGGGVARSPFYFREDNLAWIKSTIQARGDTPPSMPGISTVFTPPSGNPAPRLSASPTFTRVGNTHSVVLQWATPSATPAVSSFKISVGRNGALDNSFYVTPTSANQVTLNLSADKYTVCARPYNAIGASLPADSFSFANRDWANATVASVNCLKLDNRDNLATISGLAATGNKLVSSQISVGFGWSSAPSPADLAIAGYRVTQTVTYVSGPSRTTVATVSSPRTSVVAPRGSKVCITAAAQAVNLKLGPTSAPVCTIAN